MEAAAGLRRRRVAKNVAAAMVPPEDAGVRGTTGVDICCIPHSITIKIYIVETCQCTGSFLHKL